MFYGSPKQYNRPATTSPAVTNWAGVERARFEFYDPARVPFAVPCDLIPGFVQTKSGSPARVLRVPGFDIEALVVLDRVTGGPRIIFARGAPLTAFRVVGGSVRTSFRRWEGA